MLLLISSPGRTLVVIELGRGGGGGTLVVIELGRGGGVTECICNMCVCVVVLCMSLCLSVSLAFLLLGVCVGGGGGGIMTSFICNDFMYVLLIIILEVSETCYFHQLFTYEYRNTLWLKKTVNWLILTLLTDDFFGSCTGHSLKSKIRCRQKHAIWGYC